MNTSERLNRYYEFSPDVLGAVAFAATWQNSMTFNELADHYNVSDGPQLVTPLGEIKPQQVLHLKPRLDYDDSVARIYNGGFGSSISPSAAMHAIRLFGADPTEQLIMYGNPSAKGEYGGVITVKDASTVIKNRTFVPLAVPQLLHLESLGIKSSRLLAWSEGVEKSLAIASCSEAFGNYVNNMVLAEPTGTKERTISQLVRTFMKSGEVQKEYIRQTESPPYLEFWDKDNIWAFAKYAFGLARLTNIAKVRALTKGGFFERVESVLADSRNTHTSIIWGTESEFADNYFMYDGIEELRDKGMNVRAMPMDGMRHAAVDDIDLHAAIMLEGLLVE